MYAPGGLLPVPRNQVSLLDPWYPLLRSKSKTQCHGPSSRDSPRLTLPSGAPREIKWILNFTVRTQRPQRFQKRQCGEEASSRPQSSKSSHSALLVCLFARSTASAPQGMPFRQCALHTPEQAEECLCRPQPVLPFWLWDLMFWLFSITVSYSSWGNHSFPSNRRGIGTVGQVGERAFLWIMVRNQDHHEV